VSARPEALRVGLLHLAPALGAMAENQALIDRGVERAAALGATWVVTPELAVCGYAFAAAVGTDWIQPQPDAWMREVMARARRLGVTVFLGCPERDPDTGLLHNSLFVIDREGRLAGRHRKLSILPGSEGWSAPGKEA
jgi:omega-amidase